MIIAVALATLVGQSIANEGFAVLRPVSVMGEEIAKDPTSPIALAYAIARRNGEAPGRSSLAPVLASLLAGGAMAALDARRRPVAAAAAYAPALFVLSAWMLTHAPAFTPMTPGLGPTLGGLALAVTAAVAAGRGGAALARALNAGA